MTTLSSRSVKDMRSRLTALPDSRKGEQDFFNRMDVWRKNRVLLRTAYQAVYGMPEEHIRIRLTRWIWRWHNQLTVGKSKSALRLYGVSVTIGPSCERTLETFIDRVLNGKSELTLRSFLGRDAASTATSVQLVVLRADRVVPGDATILGGFHLSDDESVLEYYRLPLYERFELFAGATLLFTFFAPDGPVSNRDEVRKALIQHINEKLPANWPTVTVGMCANFADACTASAEERVASQIGYRFEWLRDNVRKSAGVDVDFDRMNLTLCILDSDQGISRIDVVAETETQLVIPFHVDTVPGISAQEVADHLKEFSQRQGVEITVGPTCIVPEGRAAELRRYTADFDGVLRTERAFQATRTMRQHVRETLTHPSWEMGKIRYDKTIRQMPYSSYVEEWASCIDACYSATLAQKIFLSMCDSGCSYRVFQWLMDQECPGFSKAHALGIDNSSCAALNRDKYLAIHYRRTNGRLFWVTKGLIQRLQLTDIDESLPISVLRAPFPDTYIQFEEPLTFEGFRAEIVGVFIGERYREGTWILSFSPVLVMCEDFTLRPSPVELSVRVSNSDERSFSAAMSECFDRFRKDDPGIEKHFPRHKDQEHPFYQAASLAAKVLVYLGLRSARIVEREPSPVRAPQTIRAESATDVEPTFHYLASDHHVEVGPEETLEDEQGRQLAKGSSKVTWRRGCFKMQAYGPGWSLRRRRWTRPHLVNGAKLTEGDPLPTAKDYHVR